MLEVQGDGFFVAVHGGEVIRHGPYSILPHFGLAGDRPVSCIIAAVDVFDFDYGGAVVG